MKIQHVRIRSSYEAPGEDSGGWLRGDIVIDADEAVICQGHGDYTDNYVISYVVGEGLPNENEHWDDVRVIECFACYMEYFSSLVTEEDFALVRSAE